MFTTSLWCRFQCLFHILKNFLLHCLKSVVHGTWSSIVRKKVSKWMKAMERHKGWLYFDIYTWLLDFLEMGVQTSRGIGIERRESRGRGSPSMHRRFSDLLSKSPPENWSSRDRSPDLHRRRRSHSRSPSHCVDGRHRLTRQELSPFYRGSSVDDRFCHGQLLLESVPECLCNMSRNLESQ